MKKKYYLYIFLFLLYLFLSWCMYQFFLLDKTLLLSFDINMWKLLNHIIYDLMLCLEFDPNTINFYLKNDIIS
jgi:hypothetical protein